MPKSIFILFFCVSFFNLHGQQFQQHEQLTREFIEYLNDGQFFHAENMFNTQVRQTITMEQLETIWQDIEGRLGIIQQIEELAFQDVGGAVIARAQTRFDKGALVIQVAFDNDSKISGLYFRPLDSPVNYTLPLYANTDLFREEERILEVPQGQLSAAYTYPTFVDKYPIVIFVHGSGPQDKDATIGPNKIFKDLAIGLAVQGIASFRYDKKSLIYPEYYQEIQEGMTVEDEVIEDAVSAITFANKLSGVNRREVYLIGHSLGGMLAPRIAEENRRVDGIIIMGGNARPLEDLILHQVEYLSSLDETPERERETLEGMRAQIEQLKNSDLDIGTPPHDIFLNLPISYWRDLSAYDQLSVARELKEPILVLQGGRDYQVPAEEFELWEEALEGKDNATFIFYPQLNHLFLPGQGLSTPREYSIAGHVPEAVILDIAKWIKGKK